MYLKDVAGRSRTQLTAEQANRVRAVFAQYCNVFSSGDLWYNITSTHKSPPFKQVSQQVPPTKREEMDKLIWEMETA